MTFWLLVLLGLFVLWLALAPRTGARAISTRRWLARHIPFIHRANTAQRGQFKQIMMDAALARGAAVGTESSADLKEFAGWLDSLNDKALSNLYKQANAQARQLNLDINWLLDGRAQGKVRQALTDTLLLYTLSIWRARAASPFARLEEYLANPDARGNRQFAQQVYAKLVAKNDAPLSP